LRALLGDSSAGQVSALPLYFLYFLCLLYILFLFSLSIWTLHASPRSFPRSSPQQSDTRRSQPGNRDHHDFGTKLPFRLDKLPGDIVHRGEHTAFYFPIVTCLVLSTALSFLFWLFSHFRR